jgi:glutaredoxin
MNKCNYCTNRILNNAIEPVGFTIFIRPWCPYSQNALRILNNMKVPYICYNLDHISCANIETALKRKVVAKNKKFTVPQIFYDGKYIGGHDDLVKMLNNN